jgi:hypothetical protein
MVVIVVETIENVCQEKDRVLDNKDIRVGMVSAVSSEVFAHAKE